MSETLFWTILCLAYGASIYLVAYHHGWVEGHKSGYRFGEKRGRRFSAPEQTRLPRHKASEIRLE